MTRRPPADCQNMQELRVEIDSLDRDLITLFVERSTYIDRAAELKPAENLPARTVDRVEEVISNVRSLAEQKGLDGQLAETLWRDLIEWSIRKEEVVLGRD